MIFCENIGLKVADFLSSNVLFPITLKTSQVLNEIRYFDPIDPTCRQTGAFRCPYDRKFQPFLFVCFSNSRKMGPTLGDRENFTRRQFFVSPSGFLTEISMILTWLLAFRWDYYKKWIWWSVSKILNIFLLDFPWWVFSHRTSDL